MQVISGAGEFEIAVERVEVRDTSLVMIGKMGIWESETIIEQAELPRLLRVALTPRVLRWAAGRLFAALAQRLRRRGDSS
jgi:hypothetical protein